MKRITITLITVFVFTVLYLTFCMPDGPTEINQTTVPSNLTLEREEVKWDGYTGKATFKGYYRSSEDIKGSIVLDVTSISFDNDTCIRSGLAHKWDKDLYVFEVELFHAKRKPQQVNVRTEIWDDL